MPGTLPLNPVFGRTLSLVIMWNRERFSVHFRVPTARQFPCQQEWFQHKRRGGYVG